MIYHKITNGFVIQRFDDTGKFLDQEFIAGNPVEYETQEGDPVDDIAQEMLHGCYQPFNMSSDTGDDNFSWRP